jgi:hypothetical protein
MDILGPKLGPMVFQFPVFDKWKFSKQDSFLAGLAPFLKELPGSRLQQHFGRQLAALVS